jgi:hypothetical protein
MPLIRVFRVIRGPLFSVLSVARSRVFRAFRGYRARVKAVFLTVVQTIY